MLAVAGFLDAQEVGGVLRTSLRIGLDFALRTKGPQAIWIDDHLLDGNPCRGEIRKVLLREIEPFVKGLGQIVRVVHDGPNALVVFTSEPCCGAAVSSHAATVAGPPTGIDSASGTEAV